jgi:hypothetical protein
MMAPMLGLIDFPILVLIMLVGLMARYGWPRGGDSSRGPS